MRFSFIPGEVKFYDYFEQASANLLEGAHLLQKLLNAYEDVDAQVEQITEIEHQGDFIVHEVTNLLPRTLITPIDSIDIQALTSAIDDAVDALHQAAKRMRIYRVTEIKEPARELAGLIVEGAKELDGATKALRDKKQYARVHERVVRINTIENNGDRVLEEALQDLVNHVDGLFDFIRWKEIYELLEATTDRIEDAGDAIQRVIIANV